MDFMTMPDGAEASATLWIRKDRLHTVVSSCEILLRTFGLEWPPEDAAKWLTRVHTEASKPKAQMDPLLRLCYWSGKGKKEEKSSYDVSLQSQAYELDTITVRTPSTHQRASLVTYHIDKADYCRAEEPVTTTVGDLVGALKHHYGR
ncbi:hypothetical protein PT974_02226 [Cladobotryum mycophilum]|uniref:Uncharacterized protein n=1 Tax=Cladobotryum mycophilum TaxID=491253 RepID=A0ABR0SXR2_9HYPO